MGDYVHLFVDETERTQYERSAQYNEPYASAIDDTFDAEYNKRQDRKYAVKYTDTEINVRDFAFVEYDAEIEYLESTGTQYINLDFGFDKTDEIYTSFAILTTTNDKYINSPITWNNNNNRFGMGYHNGGYCIGYGNTNTSNTLLSPKTANDKQIHNWEYKNYIFKIVDLNLTRNVSSITFGGTTKNLRLFYGYNAATQAKIASYKHIKNGQPVIDLIPVRVGNTGYMYDKVSCKLLGNSGSGNFVLGPDKYDAEIQYLESTGTQHIETEFKHNQNTRFVGKFEVINVAAMTSAWLSPFGSWGDVQASSGTNYGKMKGIENNPNNNTWRSYYAKISNSLAFNTAVKRYGLHTIDFNKNVHTMDGYTCNHTAATFTSIYNDTIFGCRSYTGAVSHGYYKFYYFQIYDNGTLVRDYIPVRKNNIGYMYDRVSGQLFGNAGTGQFILGPDV